MSQTIQEGSPIAQGLISSLSLSNNGWGTSLGTRGAFTLHKGFYRSSQSPGIFHSKWKDWNKHIIYQCLLGLSNLTLLLWVYGDCSNYRNMFYPTCRGTNLHWKRLWTPRWQRLELNPIRALGSLWWLFEQASHRSWSKEEPGICTGHFGKKLPGATPREALAFQVQTT